MKQDEQLNTLVREDTEREVFKKKKEDRTIN